MNSYRSSKFHTQRPGSSARVYDYVNSNNGTVESSKIPKFPKRTYSLENRSSSQEQKSFTRTKVSTTSMIPRFEMKKYIKNNAMVNNKNKKKPNANTSFVRDKDTSERPNSPMKEQLPAEESPDATALAKGLPPPNTVPSLECKVNKDFVNFKNNVLKIPEYWTDAGKTAATILKNAVNIVKKQYPNMEKESFEAEIQSILKATDAVKQQILTKTENIISRATQLYAEGSDTQWEGNEDDDVEAIAKKMEELKDEVRVKKYVFGDLLKCSNEVKQLMELEKVLKQKVEAKKNLRKELSDVSQKKVSKEEGQQRFLDGKKCKNNNTIEYKKREKSTLHSCGDIIRQNSTFFKDRRDKNSEVQKKEKTTQTAICWADELQKNQNSLSELNQQILELQELCKDHISKFKSFNLQIKLRGICNKAQRISVNKELEILTDEKMQLEEKNSQLLCYNKDLESAIKKKDLDLHQKDKLIIQQKKLLHVRDELIEMLKNRCNLEERQHY